MKALIVIESFMEHARGEIIREADKIEAVLASDWAHFVQRIEVPADDKAAKQK